MHKPPDDELVLWLCVIIATIAMLMATVRCGPPPNEQGTIGWACPDPHCCHRHANGGCWDYGCCDPEPEVH